MNICVLDPQWQTTEATRRALGRDVGMLVVEPQRPEHSHDEMRLPVGTFSVGSTAEPTTLRI